MSTIAMTPPKPVQRWQADDYAVKGRFVSELARPVVDLLAPRKGERILDLGCGDGVLTEAIAAYGADVLGADLSEELLEAAAAKGLKVQKVDGHALPFEDEFDAVFTNAALHWMRRPELVIAGIHRALRPASGTTQSHLPPQAFAEHAAHYPVFSGCRAQTGFRQQ